MNIILFIILILIGYIVMKFITRLIWNRFVVKHYSFMPLKHEDWIWPIILPAIIIIILIENIRLLEDKIDIY